WSVYGCVGIAIATLLVLAAAPLWMAVNNTPAIPKLPEHFALPETLGGLSYVGPLTAASAAPGTVFHAPDVSARAVYATADHPVHVSLAMYTGVPSVGNELVAFGNRLFDNEVWKVAEASHAPV